MELNRALYEEIIDKANMILKREMEKTEDERIEYNVSEISKIIDENGDFKSTRIRPTRKEIEKYLIMAVNDKRIELKQDSKKKAMAEKLKAQIDHDKARKETEKKNEQPKEQTAGFHSSRHR